MKSYDYLTGRQRNRKRTDEEKKNLRRILLAFGASIAAGLLAGTAGLLIKLLMG